MLKRFPLLAALLVLLFAAGCLDDRAAAPAPALIPQPRSVVWNDGVCLLADRTTIACADAELLPAGEWLRSELDLREAVVEEASSGEVVLRLTESDAPCGFYRLTVERRRIAIEADSYGAAISAVATLRQLADRRGDGVAVRRAVIEDAPRFGWRGVHLDVSRHFFTKEEVMSLLDEMARYKFNKFHWHLVDDQGWRVEIRRYPELTRRGAWRDPARHENDRLCREQAVATDDADMELPADRLRVEGRDTLYGGYYTQQEIREVVAHAAARGIDVLPEIDMPGHSLAAITSYPSLACFGRGAWGKNFSSPLCLGSDEVIEFCKGVYSEIFELFPYEYVHLGADEVEKINWERCPACQRRMRTEHLADCAALQAWFVREMEAFFRANGRRLVGWDEVVKDGLSTEAVIHWWRSWFPDALPRATAQGNRVIVSANEWFYMDNEEDNGSLAKIYGFEPVPDSLCEAQRERVLGVQAALWAERVPSWRRVQYRYFPRLMAVSEQAWGRNGGDFDDFARRVGIHCAQLDRRGVNYRIPKPGNICDRNLFVDSLCVAPVSAVEGLTIRYTTDGTIPTSSSPRYEEPFYLHETTLLRMRCFHPDGRPGDTHDIRCIRIDPAPARRPDGALQPGLQAAVYDLRSGHDCDAIRSNRVTATPVVGGVAIPEAAAVPVGLTLTGYIDIPQTDDYAFMLVSDDGSRLFVDGLLTVDNDGEHPARQATGAIRLERGLHAFEVEYFDPNGGMLELRMRAEDGSWTEVPAAWFSCDCAE